MTYKVGDKVRILHTDYEGEGLDVGTVHEIVGVDDEGVDLLSKDGEELYFFDREVAPYTTTLHFTAMLTEMQSVAEKYGRTICTISMNEGPIVIGVVDK